jgi:DNA-binding response OmpR family regulator
MAAPPAASRRILLVDDDRGLRVALSAILKDDGHLVELAGDGPEAVALLDAYPFDIVLLDFGLPSMSGLDVLARARALETPPRVIVMTADDTPETLLTAIRRQAFRYLRKPFPPGTIVEVVHEAIAATDVATLSIEVVSARPDWLEIIAPCALEMTDRIQSTPTRSPRPRWASRTSLLSTRQRIWRTCKPTT